MRRSDYLRFFSLLSRTKTKYAECVKITRTDGTIFRFTSHDNPLKIMEENGIIREYQSANSFSLTSLETSSGLVVSNMDIDGAIDADAITENDLRNGFFDNANFELFLAYWSNSNIRTLPLRTSWVGEIQMDGPKYKVDLRGIAQRLAQTFIQTTSLECRYDFCNSKCGLSAATFTSEYRVREVFSRDIFRVFNMPAPFRENAYQWGKAKILTGPNAGVEMEILRQYEDRVQLFLPLNFPLEPEDDVELMRGCNKTWDKCKEFENTINFGGEPFLAGNDILSRYPDASDDETNPEELASEFSAFLEREE